MTGTFWRDQAACSLANAHLFDAVDAERYHVRERIADAVAICGGCPVAQRCLLDAIANRDSGVRGGKLLDLGKPRRVPSDAPYNRGQRLKPPAACGTEAGARRHYRAGEPLCQACRTAWTTARRKYRTRKQAA